MKTAAKDFKMTELGPIPKDWEVKRLGEIGTFSKGSGISRDQAHTGWLPCIRYGEIYTDHNDWIRDFKSHITSEIAAGAKLLNAGDILFAGSGETKEEIGKAVAYLGGEKNAYCGGDILVLSPHSEHSSKYLGYVLNSRPVVVQKASRGQGDAVVHIKADSLAEVSAPIPPLDEQRKIAAALSDVDEMIAALERLIEKKRKVRVSTACDLIEGRRRLVVHNEEFKDSEVGRIPRDWDVLPLRELFDLRMEKNTNGEMRMILSVMKDIGVIPYAEKGNVGNRAKDDLTQYLIARVGDVVMNSMNVIIGSVGVTKWDGCISPAYYALTPKENANSIYYNAWFSRPSTQARIKERACGMMEIRLKIGIDDLLDMRFPVPSVAEQKAIAKVLGDMDAEIAALEAELAKTRQLKQGMMQELLTGKTRFGIR